MHLLQFKSIILIHFILLFSLSAKIDKKTFIREYTYTAGEADSKLTARAISLVQVKRLLLEEVSTYIEKYVEVELQEIVEGGQTDFKEITKEHLISISASLTETEILEEKWNGEEYWLKVKITLETDHLEKKISTIAGDRTKLLNLYKIQKQNNEAIAKIDSLNKELAEVKSETEKLSLANKHLSNIKILTYGDIVTKGFKLLDNDGLEKEKRLSKILFYCEEAIELNPNLSIAYLLRGIAKDALSNDYQGAIDDYTRILEIDSSLSFVVYSLRAGVKKHLPDLQGAIEDYTTAIKIDSTSDLFLGRGTCKHLLSNFDEALDDYNISIRLDSKNMGTYLRRGQVKGEMSDFMSAIADLTQSIMLYQELGKNNHRNVEDSKHLVEAYYFRALSKTGLKDYKGAISDFEKTLSRPSDFDDVFDFMASCYLLDGNSQKAMEFYIKAAKSGSEKSQKTLKELGISWKN